MASTTFINNQTVIVADWLNDVNASTYDGESISGILNGSTLSLQTGGLDALLIDASQNVTFADGSYVAKSGAAGVINLNGSTISVDYTMPASTGGSSVGPITINDGVEVTIPDGSRWVIL